MTPRTITVVVLLLVGVVTITSMMTHAWRYRLRRDPTTMSSASQAPSMSARTFTIRLPQAKALRGIVLALFFVDLELALLNGISIPVKAAAALYLLTALGLSVLELVRRRGRRPEAVPTRS